MEGSVSTSSSFAGVFVKTSSDVIWRDPCYYNFKNIHNDAFYSRLVNILQKINIILKLEDNH